MMKEKQQLSNLPKIVVFILLMIFYQQQFVHATDDINFSKIGIEHGLSQLSVMTIYQDETGIMWFGTREGISRYNGNSMDLIMPVANDSNSLSGNLVSKICGDGNGHIYIQSNYGVNEYEMRTGKMKVIQRDQVDAVTFGVRNLWTAEGNKLYTWQNGIKQLYVEIDEINSPIKTILQTSDQRIVLGTLSSGVYILDQNKKYRLAIPDCSQVSSLFEDSKQNIWVGTWLKGLYKIERNGNIQNYRHQSEHHKGISSDFVRAITQDNKQFLWIGTQKGLDKLNIENEQFTNYESGGIASQKLSNESVWSLYKDSQGTIWLGTYFGGVNYFNPDIDFYTFHNLSQGDFYKKPYPIISNIIEDKNGQLLLCTEGQGLLIYNPKTKEYQNIRQGEGDRALSANNIKTAYYDEDEHVLWLGMHLGDVTRVDLKTLRTKQYRHIKPEWKQSDIVRAILPYQNNLLIATYNGLFKLNLQTHQIELFSDKLHEEVSYFTDVKILGDEMWLASNGLYRYNLKTGRIRSYTKQSDGLGSISHSHISKLLIDSKERLWVATSGGGLNLYVPDTDSFIHYDKSNSDLKNNYISNIMESRMGYIFIATTHGLNILDPDNGSIYHYAVENGFPLNSLYNGGMCALRSNEIYVAGVNGMVSFFEENLSIPQRAFNLHFVNLAINNVLIEPQDESGILEYVLPYTSSITLNHKQSMVTIEFASNNYITFNKPLYRYRMEGLSDQWRELPMGLNRLNFMNLTPGKYHLHLQALSAIDREPVANTYLKIRVLPPFYSSWYAFLIYILFISFLVWRYIAFTRSKLILKTSLEYEKKQKEQINEVNQSKLRFFTNVSHEFRTPLTLIAGQVDMLMQMSNIQPAAFNRILNIKRNTQTMQNLINELLEFRKTEQGYLSIKVHERDIVEFLYEVYLSFREYAVYRDVSFEFDHEEESIKLWFDPMQMQKVFYNLISNAFKYTSKKGSIKINIREAATDVIVEVMDSGVGISSDHVEKIFDRFYQAENGLQISNMSPGTGIGLALTKNIIEAHKAEIEVVSEKDVGTKFIIKLKKGKSHFSEEQINKDQDASTYIADLDAIDEEFMAEMKGIQTHDNKPLFSMLIVEDNDDLREMLKQIFEPLYTIYTATDGEEGLAMTMEHQPDIVLSDLMMPKMSGSEMCSKIKENFLLCHIPVVLLTAQTAVEYNIEGLRLGADDYITKPFNVKTLITRCNNLVNNRRILQEKFSKQVDSSPRLVATNQLDRDFIEKAQQVVEENLDNSEFDVQMFSREMALGRTKLFTKIKGITGQTPNDFILNVKLKKAAFWLMNNPEYNITDITYMLGFSSPKYFSKCFKDQFGVSPSSYRKGGEEDDLEEQDDAEI